MPDGPSIADWVAVDWGTSHLRAWIMGDDDRPLAEKRSDAGAAVLRRDGFETALLELISMYLPDGHATPVICCGMAGARGGWAETAYATAPCPPPGAALARKVPTADERLDVRILAGVAQRRPPDVMRGEETQIAGFLRQRPDFDGVLCLTGSHTKWARVSAGEIAGFRTCMTGELFALLASASTLRDAVAGETWDETEFAAGVNCGLTRPQSLGAELFAIRAAHVLDEPGSPAGRSRLSGLLIGAELAAMRAYWLGHALAVIGEETPGRLYLSALASQGVDAPFHDAAALAVAGLALARPALMEPSR